MHRFLIVVSAIGIVSFLVLSAQKTYAQIDLDLLLNTPTPSPLPPGQEYILELEQLDLSTASDSGQFGSFSSSERKQFEEQGYIVRSKNQNISFVVDRTQIAFGSFKTAPTQEEESTATISSEETGFQVIMEAKTAFSSANNTTIPPTRCDSRQTCSPMRAQEWKDTQTPGWGYNLSGSQAPPDFKNKTFYRPPSLDGYVSLLKNGEPARKTTATLSWKVLTAGSNEETYSSILKFFALPY